MFPSPARLLSRTALLARDVSPLWAAKQFAPEGATKSKIRTLRRREQRLKRQIIRDVNNLKQHTLKEQSFSVDPVLGAQGNLFMNHVRKELVEPTNLAYGITQLELEKLALGAQQSAVRLAMNGAVQKQIAATEEKKRLALLTILHVRNTNAADRKKLALKVAREEFQRFEGDTGLPEVQAAVFTVKIHLAFDHLKVSPKDKQHIQGVRHLVQQRQRILKYLKRDDPERYYHAIAKLGLTDDVVTSEFPMGRQYFQDFKVWGEKQLVKLSDKQKRKEQKFEALRKKVNEYHSLAKKNLAQVAEM